MAATWIDWFLSINATLIPAAVVSSGIGQLVFIAPDGGTPLSGNKIAFYTSAAEIAAALAAANITAQTAEDMTAAIAQDLRLARVYVATYAGGEDVQDAMDRAAANVDVGAFGIVSRTSTDLELAAGWITADSNRRGRYLLGVQTDDTDVLAGTKPASLAACEIGECALFYSADGESTVAAWLGRVAAFPLINGRPAASMVRLQTVALSTVTEAQILAITDDADALVLVPRAQGSGASERVVAGVNSYGGTGLSPMLSLIYLSRRLYEAVVSGVVPYQIRGEAIRADVSGEAIVSGWLSPVLSDLAGLFTPGSITEDGVSVGLPDGYRLEVASGAGVLTATITVLVAREARSLSISVEAQEV